MPITPIAFILKVNAIQYDGTNGQDIADYLDKTLTSDTGTELVIVVDPTSSMHIPLNWWIAFSTAFWGDPVVTHYDQMRVIAPDDLEANFQELT